MDFALYFEPENTMPTFHMMKLVILIFFFKKKKKKAKLCVLILIHGFILLFQALKILFVWDSYFTSWIKGLEDIGDVFLVWCNEMAAKICFYFLLCIFIVALSNKFLKN